MLTASHPILLDVRAAVTLEQVLDRVRQGAGRADGSEEGGCLVGDEGCCAPLGRQALDERGGCCILDDDRGTRAISQLGEVLVNSTKLGTEGSALRFSFLLLCGVTRLAIK